MATVTNAVKDEVSRLLGGKPDDISNNEGVEKEETLLESEQELGEEEVIPGEEQQGAETEDETQEETQEEEQEQVVDEGESDEGEKSESDLDELRKENDELRALLEDVLESKKEKDKKEPEPEQGKDKPQVEIKAQDYVTSTDIDAIVTGEGSASVETLNKVLNKVRKDTANEVIEHVVKSIPQIVATEANRVVATHLAVNEFYAVNKNLRPFKKFTGLVYSELEANHPDKQLLDFLEGSDAAVAGGYDLATEVKKRLKMRQTGKPENKPENRSKQPGGTSGSARRGFKEKPPAPTGVKSEVEALKGRFGVR
jgi:hypothetical protein